MSRKKKINFGRIFRLTVAAVIILLVIFSLFKLFTGARWDGERRISLVIDGEPLGLFSISPDTRQAIFIAIPGNVMLDVPYGYSKFPANAVYKLGSLDKARGGGKLLAHAVENTFGVTVEGFIVSSSTSKFKLPTTSAELINFKKTYFSLAGLLPGVLKFASLRKNFETNFAISDLWRLWLAMRSLRSDEISFVDIGRSDVSENEKLPDGTVVANINYELLDRLLAISFQDQKVRVENVSVEVINATGQEKQAAQFSRILTNLGASVVTKSTASQTQTESCQVSVLARSNLSSIIVERLKVLYGCKVNLTSETAISDIKVILGMEFIK